MKATFSISQKIIDDNNKVITEGTFKILFDGDDVGYDSFTSAVATLSNDVSTLLSNIGDDLGKEKL